MAYRVNYMEVGKEVLVAGIGGTIAGAAHFMFLAPQFPGTTMGVKTSTIVDAIAAFVVGVVTTMYARTAMAKLAGYGFAGTLLAVGILDQLGYLAAPTRLAVPRAIRPAAIRTVPRASYRAGPGVVVDKAGTVPQVAPGTFG